MKRGEVYWAELTPRSGSEQTGRRPVIVLSHDGFNNAPNWRSIIVVPMSTSPAQSLRGPTAIPISAAEAGLAKAGVALCHQITTLDRSKLSRWVGKLSSRALTQVEEGLRAAIDID
jgi:mRNA interferase MazF